MASYTLAPDAFQQFFDDNGNPLSGGTLGTFLSGLATPAVTYIDAVGTPNTNPIVLDAGGRARIYLDAVSYKFILKDMNGVQVGPTMDPVSAINVGLTGLGDAFDFGGQSSYPVTNTSLASGATFDKLQPGTGVYIIDSATLLGTYVLRATGVTSSTNTLTVVLVNLSDGVPDTPIATLTISSTTGAIGTSGVVAFGTGGTSKQYGIKASVDSGEAYVWAIKLVRTS